MSEPKIYLPMVVEHPPVPPARRRWWVMGLCALGAGGALTGLFYAAARWETAPKAEVRFMVPDIQNRPVSILDRSARLNP
jgi:hypothetical protein